jgi:HEAT repeat protein
MRSISVRADQGLPAGPEQVVEWLLSVQGEKALPGIIDAMRLTKEDSLNEITGQIEQHAEQKAAPIVVDRLRIIEDHDRLAMILSRLERYLGSNPAARKFYRENLESSSEQLRSQAAYALTNFGASEDGPALLQALGAETNEHIADTMAAGCARFATDAMTDSLIALWSSSDDQQVRKNCMNALGRMKSPRASAAMLDSLKRGGSDRNAILGLVGDQKIAAASGIVLDLLKEGKLSDLEKSTALTTLGKLGASEAAPTLMKSLKEDLGIMERRRISYFVLTDGNRRASMGLHPALEALMLLGDAHVLDASEAILKGDYDDRIREQVVTSLLKIDSIKADELIILALRDSSDRVAARAAQIAGSALLVEATPLLRRLLRSQSSEVRNNAVLALRAFADFGLQGQ